MKDYSRKHWTDYQYRDWMRATPAKAVWNSILSQNTGHGEFSINKARKNSLSKAVANYLKQSEFKKPGRDRSFPEMEDMWEGPPGIGEPDPNIHFDYPWNLQPGGPNPWSVVFRLISDSCYCPEGTEDWEVHGTEPIYALTITDLWDSSTTFTITGGYGTNVVTGTISAGPDEKGYINFTGFMTSVEGVTGNANYLMPACRTCECDGAPLAASASTPSTIVRGATVTIYVDDGVPPYDWTLAGGNCNVSTGFSLSAAQTAIPEVDLTATASATGTAEVTCTDKCEDSVKQNVRCTFSGWVHKNYNCTISGAWTGYFGVPWIDPLVWVMVQDGCKKQWQVNYGFVQRTSACSGPTCNQTGQSECLTPFTCSIVSGLGATAVGSYACCHRASDNQCRSFNPQYEYFEWQ